MLHEGTKSQKFGYIAGSTLRLLGKLAYKAGKLFFLLVSVLFVHVLKF
jgi:hypothetical protein